MVEMLMCERVFAERFFSKMSLVAFESDGARFVADEENTTRLPSLDTDGAAELLLAKIPDPEVLTRVVLPVVRSRR
jgi:hypothetical protein